ncbi:MAG: complex I NDUFA9 subunit family protein [Betaproteobacteria bacterium]|nr:complex I NDUFA9 subunit family protein [Betaproteobacteria bacterium]
MKINKVLLVGGSGFLGASVAEQLVRRGIFVTVPTRLSERAKHLRLLPTMEVVEADIHDANRLAALVSGKDAVINLVGILHGDFEREHVTLPRQIAEACVARGVSRLIHISALNASITGPSLYLQSRGHGEEAVRSVATRHPELDVTIFQPSVVFGAKDRFLNMFASLAMFSPIVPLGSPDARFQPVWVEDVARAVVQSLPMRETFGHTYPLVGPHEYTLRELLEFVMRVTGHHRPILGLGSGLSSLQAAVFERLPGKLITRDNMRSMSIPNTSSEPFPAIFGEAHAMESVVPGYLQHGAKDSAGRARYDRLRFRAGRNR